MNAEELQQLVKYIRDALKCSYIGLSVQEIQALDQRLDSDAYKAAIAVSEFFEAKRAGVI